ncbi:hypothetical protein [Pedobacter frigiditerrae]|uniref:hypothetical protein n=1 Tax=Pedobacter frigiditerrae TaxID=2530452 RepID=UPI00292D165F|nr:hypothetical protein [Pedobacter frigiditerrae]
MRKGPSLKSIKRIPLLIFVLIFAYFLMTLVFCYGNIGRNVRVEAKILYGVTGKNPQVDIGGNKFNRGYEGMLYWKVKNFKEAVFLNFANSKEILRFYDLIYMLILNIVVFIIVNRMTEDTIFSSFTENGFKVIIFIIIFSPFFDVLIYFISRYFIKELTDNQLTAVSMPSFSYLRIMVSIFLINLIPLLIKKGQSLQQENELTI